MSLKYTLLGFLTYGPLTGYDLKKHINNSTKFFWDAKLSQIYPTLKKIENDGLAVSEVMPQNGKPDKKIYIITDKGRAALLAWLGDFPKEITATKDSELPRSFFAGSLEKENILTHLRHHMALRQAQLHKYQTETKDYIKQVIIDTGLEREAIMWELTRRFGEQYEQMYITWLEDAIQLIEDEM